MVQDWGAPTGSLPVVRKLLGLQRFSPQTVSVRAARRFVQECLSGSRLEALADDAGLLVCELAANAVLHARTDFDVAVSELHDGSGVRVTVRDDAVGLPTVTAPSATAMSGRGLVLVQTLASRWGAGPSSSARKGVWFELDLAKRPDGAGVGAGNGAGFFHVGGGSSAGGGGAELSVEELLAAWSDSEPELHGAGAADGAREVVLPALDAADLLAAKEGMDDVLRELQLVLLDPRSGVGADGGDLGAVSTTEGPWEDLALARRLDLAARAFDAVRRQVRQQVSLAVAGGEGVVRLRLVLPVDTLVTAVEYRAAVEAAEGLAERGTLLGAGARALRRHRAVRRAYLGEIIAAVSS